jgi:hypothetical protein
MRNTFLAENQKRPCETWGNNMMDLDIDGEYKVDYVAQARYQLQVLEKTVMKLK